MALIKVKPTSPGRRGLVKVVNPELHKGAPHAPLLVKQSKAAGRNNTGRITMRHQGGGHRQHYRIVDFRRNKDGVPAKVAAIEYDPNRNCRIALLHFLDGEKRYILAPRNVKVGDMLQNGQGAEIRPGNALPMRYIPVGTTVHNVAAWRAPPGPACSWWPRKATTPPCASPAPRCAGCRSTAGPPSVRSATPRPS